jgi:hypothetical protein
MDPSHYSKATSQSPADGPTHRDRFSRATIDPRRRDFSSGLLTSVAGVYMPSGCSVSCRAFHSHWKRRRPAETDIHFGDAACDPAGRVKSDHCVSRAATLLYA